MRGVCMQVDDFVETLRLGFYGRRLAGPDNAPPPEQKLREVIFATTPGHGAAVLLTNCVKSRV
jgi:hypothetical protein